MPAPLTVSCSSRCSVSCWPDRLTRPAPLLAFIIESPASGLLDEGAYSVFTITSPTLCLQSADLLELFGPPIPRSLEPFLG